MGLILALIERVERYQVGGVCFYVVFVLQTRGLSV